MSDITDSGCILLEPSAPQGETARRRKRIGLALLAVAIVLALSPLLCMFLLSITSRCSFVAQWNALVGATPLVPIPDGTTLLSERDGNGNPIESAGGTIQRLYGELYIAPASLDATVAFYRQQGAICSQIGAGVATYWHCDVDATESGWGWGWVEIFSQQAYQVAPSEASEVAYHFQGSLPHEGTILRTFVNWCDDT